MRKSCLLVTLSFILNLPEAGGVGLPVFDPLNFSKNVITATQTLAMTKVLIDQYKTQLKQYDNMLSNSKGPTTQLWQNTSATISGLNQLMTTLNTYQKQLGGLNAYLGQFSDTPTYRHSPCYTASGCSSAEWSALLASRDLASQSEKKAIDALYNGLAQQQTSLQDAALNLTQLQKAARDAQGQLEATSLNNQFASQISTELMQIRALLMAQQGLLAARQQALTNREAQEAAATAQFWSGSFKASPPSQWKGVR